MYCLELDADFCYLFSSYSINVYNLGKIIFQKFLCNAILKLYRLSKIKPFVQTILRCLGSYRAVSHFICNKATL